MTNRALRKRGSLIVAVLVVLFLVVLMSTQTFQTLWLVRRGDSQQSALRQARELIELGKMIHRQYPPATDFEPARIDMGENQFGVISIEPLTQDPAGAEDGRLADATVNPLVAGDSSPTAEPSPTPRYRIVATFPAGTDGEVTATWEGID